MLTAMRQLRKQMNQPNFDSPEPNIVQNEEDVEEVLRLGE
jgi:hypothetical protein